MDPRTSEAREQASPSLSCRRFQATEAVAKVAPDALIDVPARKDSCSQGSFAPELLKLFAAPLAAPLQGLRTHNRLDQLLLEPLVHHILDRRAGTGNMAVRLCPPLDHVVVDAKVGIDE